MHLNIAVVDDEPAVREEICAWIKRQQPNCHMEAFDSGEAILAAEKLFDIVFLDIQMEGRNGIEIARILRRQSKEIVLIFITAVKEYVFDALDLYAFQYLLKPIDNAKFAQVLERAIWEAQKGKERQAEKLFIKAKNLTIYQSDILYIESRVKKVAIYTIKAGEAIAFYASMDELEQQLGTSFFRCHRGYLVNMAYIAEYNNNSITLSNGSIVYLAKKKYSAFVKAYLWYLQSGGVFSV